MKAAGRLAQVVAEALVALPIRSFSAGKTRLRKGLSAADGADLAIAVPRHTVAVAAATPGARVVVVTADTDVKAWARHTDVDLLDDPEEGLDGAAAAAVQRSTDLGIPWIIMHADLPLATPKALSRVLALAAAGPVIVPSHDGGTNLLAGTKGFGFAYGPGSFHAHLRRTPDARVLVDYRLGFDLDTPRDLALAQSLPQGAWLNEI